MSGFAVEKTTSLEIIAAWVAPKIVVPAVATSPGWYVMGEYYLPKSTMAQLDVVGCVSHASLTLRARLWDTTANAVVPGGVTITSLAGVRAKGAKVELTGGRTYQVQVECTGSTGEDRFGVAETATITD